MSSRTVFSSEDIDRAITRIAHQIVEANHGT
ncbi:MAG: bifunctional pyr operon transcriptional regulator/uracil phosphoribosyltransferase, partial [Micrococcales bacterium]